jgi:hypothetical protein
MIPRRLTHFQSALRVMGIGIGIAALAYPGRYSFISHSISSLGAMDNPAGPWSLSRIVFSLSCLTSAVIFASQARSHPSVPLVLCTAGLFGMPVPCDQYPLLHSLAAGLVVGGLFFLVLGQFLREWRLARAAGEHPTPVAYRAAAICIPVLGYAALHISGSPLKEEFQTLAIAALIAATMYSDRRMHFRRIFKTRS